MLSAEQLQQRRQGIGGSDAGTILGVNPYKTPLTLYYEKRGEIDPDDLSGREAVHWGNVLEDVVAREYSRRTRRKVRRVNRMLSHHEHPWMIGLLDRMVVGEPRILEVKTTSAFASKEAWGEPGSDAVPMTYLAQAQHYLALTCAEVCDLAVLIGGQRFQVYEIPRDEELIEALIEKEAEFWQCVLTATPPPPTNLADLAALYPTDQGGIAMASEQVLTAYESLKALKETLKDLEAQKDALEFALKSALGEAAELISPTGQRLATWKTQTSRRLDAKALKAANPGVYAQYTTETQSRVLRIK